MAFQWLSELHIRPFDLAELDGAVTRGLIPAAVAAGIDKTQPWCVLTAPLRLRSDRLGEVEIPAGFVYDQGSLPGGVRWWMAPSDPRIVKAACWHDFLSPWKGEQPPGFMVGLPASSIIVVRRLNNTQAAEELYDGMRASGASWLDAATCSRAVKTFGPKF